MSSRRNPLHLSSCYCYGYRFWGVLWKSAYSRSNMKPKSSNIHSKTGSEIDRGIGLLVSGASAQCSFHFALICMHLSSCSFHVHASSFRFAFTSFHVPSFSFHLYSCPFMFLSYSFHFHSNVHAFPFIFLPSACMFLSFCINFLSFPSCPFISFLKLWNSLVYGLARGPSATNGYR